MRTALLKSVGAVAVFLLAQGLYSAQHPTPPQGLARPSEPPIVAFSGVPGFSIVPGSPAFDQGMWQVAASGIFIGYADGGENEMIAGEGPVPPNGEFGNGPGTYTAFSNANFSLDDGAIVLVSEVTSTSFPAAPDTTEVSSVALANGTNRNDAIEMSTVRGEASPLLDCRTVSGGSATQTEVALTLNATYQYEIVAKSHVVKFYLNGALVATHQTNIPTTPLNMLFVVSSEGRPSQPVLMIINHVEFEQFPR